MPRERCWPVWTSSCRESAPTPGAELRRRTPHGRRPERGRPSLHFGDDSSPASNDSESARRTENTGSNPVGATNVVGQHATVGNLLLAEAIPSTSWLSERRARHPAPIQDTLEELPGSWATVLDRGPKFCRHGLHARRQPHT